MHPHPDEKGKFQVLNGHARLVALDVLGMRVMQCDVYDIEDVEAGIFLAVLDRLGGSNAPELRMALLHDLLERYDKEELRGHLREIDRRFSKLANPAQEAEREAPTVEKSPRPDGIIVDFQFTHPQHAMRNEAFDEFSERLG